MFFDREDFKLLLQFALVAFDDLHDGKPNLQYSTNKEFLFMSIQLFVLLFHLLFNILQ